MNLGDEKPQMSAKAERARQDRGAAPKATRREETSTVGQGTERSGSTSDLMERVVSITNLQAALKRVETNRGSPGIDGMRADELRLHLRAHWRELTRALLDETYRPQAVKRQEIPKDSGGVRILGIPTVLDRLIQQALLQVLQPIFDPTFSESSFGFRPGRSAHDAIERARGYIQAGRRVVVDVDLEKFFDRVNHDVLMGRLAKRIEDKRVLRLIRRYLEAGMMADGVVQAREEGTPQGGPLSPLLANVLLDEVDKDLERNGHAFARYADDCNVYVHSQRAGMRVMERLTKLYAKLRLKVNVEKSAVASAFERDFLGFGFWVAPGGEVKVRAAKKALRKLKERLRKLTRRSGGNSMHQTAEALARFLYGWRGYFRIAQTPGVMDAIDEWIRHRLRAIQLKHWKRGRTAYRELHQRGVSHDVAVGIAMYVRSWWRAAGQLTNVAFPKRFFDQLGIPRLGR
jgi:RNA-directed DNA polymerase